MTPEKPQEKIAVRDIVFSYLLEKLGKGGFFQIGTTSREIADTANISSQYVKFVIQTSGELCSPATQFEIIMNDLGELKNDCWYKVHDAPENLGTPGSNARDYRREESPNCTGISGSQAFFYRRGKPGSP